MDNADKRRRTFVLIACMGCMFITAVESTIVATAMAGRAYFALPAIEPHRRNCITRLA